MKEIIKFFAKDFNIRQELEMKVSSLMGLTADLKPDYVISGTGQELKKLHLSEGNIFWGIRVVETDLAPVEKINRINRGKIFKSKLENLDINNSKELGYSHVRKGKK